MEERLTMRKAVLMGFVLGALALGARVLSLRYDLRYGRCNVCGRWSVFRRQYLASVRDTDVVRSTVHGALVWQEVGGGEHRPFDGKGWICPR